MVSDKNVGLLPLCLKVMSGRVKYVRIDRVGTHRSDDYTTGLAHAEELFEVLVCPKV